MSISQNSQNLESIYIYYNPTRLFLYFLILLVTCIFSGYRLYSNAADPFIMWLLIFIMTLIGSLLYLKLIINIKKPFIKLNHDKIISRQAELAIAEIKSIRLKYNKGKYGINSPTQILIIDKQDKPRLSISPAGTGKTGEELYSIIKEYIQKLPNNSQSTLFND